jgi:hypothetical protein
MHLTRVLALATNGATRYAGGSGILSSDQTRCPPEALLAGVCCPLLHRCCTGDVGYVRQSCLRMCPGILLALCRVEGTAALVGCRTRASQPQLRGESTARSRGHVVR